MKVIVSEREVTGDRGCYANPPVGASVIEGEEIHFANVDLTADGDSLKIRIDNDRMCYLFIQRDGDTLRISNIGYDVKS
ncbi:MAG: hypothetical protein WCT08_02490 [Patescibacteria group bacterium]|jgi:hypothetical protein